MKGIENFKNFRGSGRLYVYPSPFFVLFARGSGGRVAHLSLFCLSKNKNCLSKNKKGGGGYGF
jgi:hypothetical protein